MTSTIELHRARLQAAAREEPELAILLQAMEMTSKTIAARLCNRGFNVEEVLIAMSDEFDQLKMGLAEELLL